MPGKVGVKIKAGRNLPVMDRGSDTTDAYVEIKLGSVTHKTDVCRKSLNPQWNTDWYRFELDDAELQDEPLQIRLMDHDTYSANDAIGKVNISLNPLCLENTTLSTHGKGAVMSGWIPVFDTMHGIRGEVNVIVKVDLFSDANKFRQSSCGIQFFHSPNIPHGYRAQVIHGFVEELVVNDDPEYQWIDKIRTPRASNEARQVVFLRLSGQVQRKIGLKAINLGANAVIGYTQCFDLEGDVGVVARGIGTAVTLVKIQETFPQPLQDTALIEEPMVEYLRFLERTKGTDPNSESKFDSEGAKDMPSDIVSQILGIDMGDRTSSSIVLNKKWRPNPKDNIILEELNENESIKQLLEQEDKRGEKPKQRIKHRVKHIRETSKNLLNEKLKVFKYKAREDRSHSPSPSSSFSDISRTESRTSLSELKGILSFGKNKQQSGTFNRSASEGCGMASLIVSSIMHGPSLQSISESHDSDTSSSRNQRKNRAKAETMSTTSSAKQSKSRNKAPAPHDSKFSISMTSLSSSTTEEENYSDECSETTSPNEIVVVDADTVSMVVKTVLAHDESDEDANQWIEPGTTQDNETDTRIETLSEANCKLHRVGTKISINNDAIAVNLGSLQPVDEDAATWIEPGSTADEPETVDKRRGSLLHDFRENISEKIHNLQDHMHLPNFHDKHKHHQHGLFETAMETMLIEKAHILGADTNAPSPEIIEEIAAESGNLSPKADDPKRTNRSSLRKFNFSMCRKKKKADGEIVNNSGLIGSAMQSMLLEQVNLADEIGEHLTKQSVDGAAPKMVKIPSTDNESDKSLDYIPATVTCFSDGNETDKSIDDIISNPPTRASSSDLEKFTIPKISLTHTQSPINDNSSFYSSEPQLSQTDNTPSQVTLGMPFISLTNLSISSESLDSKLNDTAVGAATNQLPFVHNPNSSSDLNIEIVQKNPIPTPAPSSSVSKSVLFAQSKQSSFEHPPVTNSLKVARNTIKSSSYTNLSTNKAPMLAPFPSLKHHRSELASAAASPGGEKVLPATPTASGHIRAESVGGKMIQSPAKLCNNSTPANAQNSKKDNSEICRRSSDSDLSVTPKVLGRKRNSLCVASERLVAATTLMRLSGPTKTSLNQDSLDMLEYPFLTMAKYPSGFIVHLGATVAARSVKLLERVPNPDEPETRDSWWKEVRMEVRSHARSLGCNVVLGYSEVTAISDDVCVLSATGTAAVINMSYNGEPTQIEQNSSSKKDLMVSSLDEGRNSVKIPETTDQMSSSKEFSTSLGGGPKGNVYNTSIHNYRCFMCHVPYSQSSVPFNVKMKKCAVCKRGKVPDVLLATIEFPECLQITGRGCLLQAQVVRAKKDLRSESNAKEISDGLPFLEYELHRLLINKLKAKGMNAIFGLKTQVSIGDKMMALIATGTAIYLTALPPPSVPKIVAGNSWTDTAKLNDLQKSLQETFERNRENYQLKSMDPDVQNGKQSDTDDSDDELPEMDLATGNKDTCVLEVDDIEDLEIITLLMEPCPPEGFTVVNTQSVPGLQDMEVVKNLQMFTQVWRAKLVVGHNIGHFPKHFHRLLQTIYFKLRTMIPCAICDLKFRMDLPESDEIQLLVTGMALGLGEPSLNKIRRKTFSGLNNGMNDSNGVSNGLNTTAVKKQSDEELIFSLDEDQTMEQIATVAANQPHLSNTNFGAHSLRLRKTSPCRTSKYNSTVRFSRHLPVRDRYGVDVTPLGYVPGGRIEKYLGNLNFFFIRESTSIRENGGISGFVHSFITEILAVVRAHVSALGGNAMVSFYMTELLLVDNQHKNQGQCLISIGGDVVHVSYFTDE